MSRQQATWRARLIVGISLIATAGHTWAADLSGPAVKEAIERGRRFLVSQQAARGYWDVDKPGFRVGITSLAVMALINSGMSPQDVPVKRGLAYLRDDEETAVQ